jgi:hypothetical protein
MRAVRTWLATAGTSTSPVVSSMPPVAPPRPVALPRDIEVNLASNLDEGSDQRVHQRSAYRYQVLSMTAVHERFLDLVLGQVGDVELTRQCTGQRRLARRRPASDEHVAAHARLAPAAFRAWQQTGGDTVVLPRQ